ncbi:MAG: hypothetical protein ACM3X0_03435 [Bacteroidota bacterium]
MANSSLLGGESLPVNHPGHDTGSLGPSDTSDSGSDTVGAAEAGQDPNLPTDIALDPDFPLIDSTFETLTEGADSGDAGLREAPDISPDQIIEKPARDR